MPSNHGREQIPFYYKNFCYNSDWSNTSNELYDEEYCEFLVLADYDPNALKNKHAIFTYENEITIRLDYPLNKEYDFKFTSDNGFTIDQFIKNIIATYKQIYADEDEDCRKIGVIPGVIPGMMNRDTSTGRYGIWGHIFEDLSLEAIYYQNGIYTFFIGS